MQAKILTTPRGNVCYWVDAVPGAKALVLLHGLTADHTLFDQQVKALAGRYTLLLWDAPAHGASRPYRDFTYAHAVEDLLAILDAEGLERVTLVGQSMGGFVAQAFIAEHPQRVEGFVGIDTCPLGEDYYSRSDRWWLRQVEGMALWYPLPLLRWAMTRQCARTPYGRANMRAILQQYGKRELCRLMGLGFGDFLTINRDITIPCPTLLMIGEFDKTGKVRQYCDAWHEKTGFPLLVIANAAHNANADQPERVNQAIQQFVDGLGRSPDKANA